MSNLSISAKALFGASKTEDGSFTIESISGDMKFVRFSNLKVTTAKHMMKIGDKVDWIDDGSFKLPEGWRSFERDGMIYFTDKEDTRADMGSVTWEKLEGEKAA